MINHKARDIIQKFEINKFVETGVFQGDTLMIAQSWFCEFYKEFNTGPWRQGETSKYTIYEVESNQDYVNQFLIPKWQEQRNVQIACSDSVKWLNENIPMLNTSWNNVFFYLDSHSHGSPNPEPLRDEIRAICSGMKKAIISIDDWNIPGVAGDIYGLDLIRDCFGRQDVKIFNCLEHNYHGKYSCFIFVGYDPSFVDEKISGLPFIEDKI